MITENIYNYKPYTYKIKYLFWYSSIYIMFESNIISRYSHMSKDIAESIIGMLNGAYLLGFMECQKNTNENKGKL